MDVLFFIRYYHCSTTYRSFFRSFICQLEIYLVSDHFREKKIQNKNSQFNSGCEKVFSIELLDIILFKNNMKQKFDFCLQIKLEEFIEFVNIKSLLKSL